MEDTTVITRQSPGVCLFGSILFGGASLYIVLFDISPDYILSLLWLLNSVLFFLAYLRFRKKSKIELRENEIFDESTGSTTTISEIREVVPGSAKMKFLHKTGEISFLAATDISWKNRKRILNHLACRGVTVSR